MTNTQQEFIKCLKAYIKGEKLNKIEDDKELIKLSVEQSLQTLLYPVYNDKSYKKYYIDWVLKQEKFLSLQEEITNIFNINNINHLYLKGSVLCKIYDDPSIRTRGDIDVYVDINDLDKAKKLLLNDGFIDEDGECTHHANMKKNGVEVELHFLMIDDNHDKNTVDYFSKPFDIAKNISNNLYKLNDTEHFIFCLEHFAHHLRNGAGIRYMLDFYYMLKKTNIDFNKLHNDLKYLELNKLYNNVLNVIYYLTNEKIDEYIEEDIIYFIEYMLKSGIHGFGSLNGDFNSANVVNKKNYFFARVFLTNRIYRISLYPKLGSKIIFYPICLIRHWLHLIRPKRVINFFKLYFSKSKKKDLYNKLGI